MSDKHLIEQCGTLDHLLPGHQVLADEGFIFTIQEIVALHHAEAIKQVRSRFITHTFSGKNTCGMSEWTATTKIYKLRTNKYDNA